VLLIGGGVSVATAWALAPALETLGVPLMTSWNGADRVASAHPLFVGRPNTWGQRSANILLAQADLIVALGTRLGMQQTGFNWGEWGPGRVVQVDVDEAELAKGHPRVDVPLQADANRVLELLAAAPRVDVSPWVCFCREVRTTLPIIDPANSRNPAYLSPFDLLDQLSEHLADEDVMIPASSGSGQFVPMQTFRNRPGQRVITNKGLASMGYGLAAAIGACLVDPRRRTVLVEGDGSFAQNMQELGTMAVQQLNVKVFLLDNDGYASIRTTQRNYFGGQYLGCDKATGLWLPSWSGLAVAYGIPWIEVGPVGLAEPAVAALLDAVGPALFIVKVDPEQTYLPKVTSRVAEDGSMVSSAIHHMSPDLPAEVASTVFRYSPDRPS
jgi:acetolactate synthase-1/2/3 large subunit